MNRFIGILALIGFLLSALVHFATFTNIDVQSKFPNVWLLHLGCFVVFVPLALSIRRTNADSIISELQSVLPVWAFALLIVTFAYILINFMLFFDRTGGGSPEEISGAFFLQSHGTIIRQISEAEYHLQKAYIVRGFSGHWLAFYLMPALYFLLRPHSIGTRDRGDI